MKYTTILTRSEALYYVNIDKIVHISWSKQHACTLVELIDGTTLYTREQPEEIIKRIGGEII